MVDDSRWQDRKKKTRTAPITRGEDGTDRIVVKAKTYTAKYRDGQGIVREVATGCRDKSAAANKLAELERRAELVKGNVLTAAEDQTVRHQTVPLAEHIADFLEHQQGRGITQMHLKNTRSRLDRVAGDCGFVRLGELQAVALERWLGSRSYWAWGLRHATDTVRHVFLWQLVCPDRATAEKPVPACAQG